MIKINDVEVWKTYPEFSFIQGSSFGRVRTIDRYVPHWQGGKRLIKGRILKQHLRKNGYIDVEFNVNGKHVNRSVHRIIALCFIPNNDNLIEVNHKDCDPSNNNVSNLEWVTHKENIEYRDKCGHTARNNAPKSPVYVLNLKTRKVLWFESQHEASRVLGVYLQNISSVLKMKRNNTGGFWFTYADCNAVEKVRKKFGDETASKVNQLINKNKLV